MQKPVNIEALATRLAEQMVAKILEKMPTSTTTIIHAGGLAGAPSATDGQEDQAPIPIDDKVIVSNSSDISGMERSGDSIIQDTKTTHDAGLQASKDKLARLKRG